MFRCQASVSHRQAAGASADRRQLSREIQQLRVELSQKNLKLQNIEADCQQKIGELEQKLGDALNQRQLLQVSVSRSLCLNVLQSLSVCLSVCLISLCCTGETWGTVDGE